MFSACAIMSVFNEEDIIFETVSKLIDNGLSVCIIDNECTDLTINKIQSLVGRGIVDIHPLILLEDCLHVFKRKSLNMDMQKPSIITS